LALLQANTHQAPAFEPTRARRNRKAQAPKSPAPRKSRPLATKVPTRRKPADIPESTLAYKKGGTKCGGREMRCQDRTLFVDYLLTWRRPAATSPSRLFDFFRFSVISIQILCYFVLSGFSFFFINPANQGVRLVFFVMAVFQHVMQVPYLRPQNRGFEESENCGELA